MFLEMFVILNKYLIFVDERVFVHIDVYVEFSLCIYFKSLVSR